MADAKLGVMKEDPDHCVLTCLALMTPEPKYVDKEAGKAHPEAQGGLMQLHLAGKGIQ